MGKKTKHNPPRKPKPSFIKFSKVQRNYLNEIIVRQRREFNEALQLVHEELGITEKISQAPSGTYTLRQDFSGLDVLPIKPESKKEADAEKKVETPEGSPPPVISKEKSSKDN